MSRALPWVIALLTAGALGFALVVNQISEGYRDGPGTFAPWIVATLASSAVGLILATRRSRNAIGWLLLAQGLSLSMLAVAATTAEYATFVDPSKLSGGEWAVLIDQRAWPLLFFFVPFVAYVFPDGRLPSRRWRPLVAGFGASCAVLLATSLLAHNRYEDPFRGVASPLPDAPTRLIDIPFAVSGLGVLAGLVAAAVAVWSRRRGATPVERLQLRWFAFAVALVPLAVVACLVEAAVTGTQGIVTALAVPVVLIGIPVSIGTAVMRYRLYEIDVLINRTLVYSALSVGLVATFAAVSLGLGVAIGGGSAIPTAAATLAVALAFGPLRSRLQAAVDRRFDRTRYEGRLTVERFLRDLRAGRATPEQTGSVLARALDDPSLELHFWLPADRVHVDAWGRVVERVDEPGRARTPVERGELILATVVHDERLLERPDLLLGVIDTAGLAIEIARLQVEVRRKLAEVEESRTRIVTAGYEERRRLERDIHDGAQQRLVSIGLALRHLQGRLPPASAEAELADSTVAEVTHAIDELRELARGVRPAGLDDGLAPALRELAARSHLRASVEATDERFDDRLETAAYFVASEALANAAKHAHASRVRLSAARRNGSLVVSIADDGVGGAVTTNGSGLTGMSDRVAALGGSLAVESPPGEGTVVTAELPCAS